MAHLIAKLFLKLTGWTPTDPPPEPHRFVFIGAHHTTNWDFIYMLAFTHYFRVKVSWMGKHVLFRPPLGWLMRRLGGIPIVRHKRGDVVTTMARAFEENELLVLAISPEGTRRPVEYWRSGFYHIANTAGVPIVPGYLDYSRRRGGFGPALIPTGNVTKDMDVFRHFYADKIPLHPEKAGSVRLREEDA